MLRSVIDGSVTFYNDILTSRLEVGIVLVCENECNERRIFEELF